MRFTIDIRRSKVPFRFRKRTKFRNSETRQSVSGFSNYERIWIAGFDVCLEWGSFDKTRPDYAADARRAAKRAVS